MDSPNVHPQLKKEIKERRQISTVNDVFCYLLNTENMVPSRYDSKQRMHQTPCAGNTNKDKNIKFKLLFILLMVTWSLLLVL